MDFFGKFDYTICFWTSTVTIHFNRYYFSLKRIDITSNGFVRTSIFWKCVNYFIVGFRSQFFFWKFNIITTCRLVSYMKYELFKIDIFKPGLRRFIDCPLKNAEKIKNYTNFVKYFVCAYNLTYFRATLLLCKNEYKDVHQLPLQPEQWSPIFRLSSAPADIMKVILEE